MTPNREDYLKLILELGGDEQQINNKQIVAGLDVSPASVSEMLSKLVKEDLVIHTPYQGVQLTEKGLRFASALIRKHRLWEVFLVEKLHYSFNDVHEEAEVLEHVTSDTLANRLDAFLEYPEYCPHGGKIPQFHEDLHEARRKTLVDYPVGTKVRIARVIDEKDLLDYLVALNLSIHEEYEIAEMAPYEGPVTLKKDDKTILLGYKAASTIFVETV
ncbi:metal-dependent transcriptional regulator [Enterococcus nangangensis]|uniref:metal-dependent transcriptional regulator n=1 Tax=Enterococcus nangangensis TaxID=2559926 RepID=UPI0010F866E0|nr:metal-dependent transcriptional regulator [Enterococcus nangangensis]